MNLHEAITNLNILSSYETSEEKHNKYKECIHSILEVVDKKDDKISELKQTLGSKEFEIIILENKNKELKDFINEVYQMLNKVGYLQGAFKTKYTIEYMKEKKSLWIKN